MLLTHNNIYLLYKLNMNFAHATIFWTLALWLSSTGCSGQIQDNIYKITEEERLIFGNMTTFTTTTSTVSHMEADRLLPGNIIFADYGSLKTTNGTNTITLAGSDNSLGYRNGPSLDARFDGSVGFIQRPNTHQVFIADSGNDCLRRLDRQTGLVTDLAGTCTSPGYADGNATFAKFNSPRRLLSDPQDSSIIIITDSGNDAIRSLNLDTMIVSTIANSSELNNPRFTLWENNSNMSLLVAGWSRISRITLKDRLISRVSGGDFGFADGSLERARYEGITDMIFVRNDLYIAADKNNARLRIVDLLNMRVTSICTGVQSYADGPVSSCNIIGPHSPLLLNSTLYIGARGAIRQLPVQHQELRQLQVLAWLQVNSGTELLPTTLEESSTGTPELTTTGLSGTPDKDLDVWPTAFLSGLCLIFAVLTVTFIILFLKTKQEVRSWRNNKCQVVMQSPNTVELRESANNDGVGLLYQVLDSSRTLGNQDYSRLNLQQPADPDIQIPEISERCAYVDNPRLAAADRHSSRTSESYDYVGNPQLTDNYSQ